MDQRSKEELKRDGDYTPEYWRKLKAERGWTTEKHGQRKPPGRGKRTVPSREVKEGKGVGR